MQGDPEDKVHPSVLDVRMSRLERLVGTDPGFFVLALHSFVESFIIGSFPAWKECRAFPELLWDFKDYLASKFTIAPEDQRALIRISKEHAAANKVRHEFLRLDPEEAVAATHNFLGFCRACSISHRLLDTLRGSLKVWEEKKSPLESSEELAKLRYDLFVVQRDNRKLLEQASAAREASARAEGLDAQLRARTAELEQEHARADSKAGRVDALRGELNRLTQERKALTAELERFRDLDLYVEHLNRFSVYTRTRRDYERSLMRLTAEQQQTLDAIAIGHDFLIRGGAGTGKTIVLLHAYGKAHRFVATELGLAPPARAVLLTYTTTLVKYDRYLAELLKAAESPGIIQTADSFFLAQLRCIDPAWYVDYRAMEGLAERHNTTGFLSGAELATEIESFIFANIVTRQEYVEEAVPRRGMRQPLSRTQRGQVWEIRDRIAAEMEQTHGFSKNYSRLKLIQHLERPGGSAGGDPHVEPGDGPLDIDLAFVDESQDLTAADLRALKLMCRRGIIMAGDTAQAIYGLGSPYKRAGIFISGRTRVLRIDFRTTCPIHDLATRYRALCREDIEEEKVVTNAFREGPAPELYKAGTQEELLGLLVEKASLFIEKLGYEPENVTILAPTKADLNTIRERLARRSIKAMNIRDDGFSFEKDDIVRLCTLHSSKGLDFPVVLLYLPALPTGEAYEEKASTGLARNLIYVAISRAMDNLNVFMLDSAKEEAILDLQEAFAGISAR